MSNQQTRKRHADLVDRMANTLGIDLEEKIMEGQLQIDTLGDAVLACTGCSNPEYCDHWMDQQNDTTDQAPDYCRNTEIFNFLKDGKSV